MSDYELKAHVAPASQGRRIAALSMLGIIAITTFSLGLSLITIAVQYVRKPNKTETAEPPPLRATNLVVDQAAYIGSAANVGGALNLGSFGSSSQGSGVCAPTAPVPAGSGGPYVPYYYVPSGSNCQNWPYVSVLDLDTYGNGTNATDVSIDALPPGLQGQILFLLNEGNHNVYLWSCEGEYVGCSGKTAGTLIELPGFNTSYIPLITSDWALLQYYTTRYGGAAHWMVLATSGHPSLDVAPSGSAGSGLSSTVSTCGTGAHVLHAGALSGTFVTGTGASSCTISMYPALLSGTSSPVCTVSDMTSLTSVIAYTTTIGAGANIGGAYIEPIVISLSGAGLASQTLAVRCINTSP